MTAERESRIVSAEGVTPALREVWLSGYRDGRDDHEAGAWIDDPRTPYDNPAATPDLAYTVQVQAERIAAVEALYLAWEGDHDLNYTAAQVALAISGALGLVTE